MTLVNAETGELIRSGDVGALVVPEEMAVPATIEEAEERLGGVVGILNAAGWGVAATVWAFTEDQQGSNQHSSKVTNALGITEFAEIGIRGLASPTTVRKYRRAWQNAIDEGWAEPTKPGEVVQLPAQDFKEATDAHVSANSGDNEWYTPAEYIEAARQVMGGIDLDPATSPEANEVVQATAFYTEDDNGLERQWKGRVWMNPPYAQPACSHFARKLAESFAEGDVTEACVLVNNATETAWFNSMIEVASAVCFPRGRIRFWHPEKKSAPLQGQAVVYLGSNVETFCSAFGQFGWTARL